MALENYGRIMQGASDFAMQPYNALQDARRNQRTNTLLDLRAQQMQGEIDDDAEWDQAFANRDIDTMMKLDPQATQTLVQHWQGQKMAGLEEIPISRQPIDMGELQKQQMAEQKFAFDKMDSNRNYRLNAAQESRLANQGNQPAPQLKDVTLPDGRVQSMWLLPGQSSGTAVGAPRSADATVKPLTETDKKVGVLFGSMYGAEPKITTHKGKDTSSKWDAMLGAIPLDGDMAKAYQSQEYKAYESAAKRWSANLLYIKSGATAPPEEIKSTYIQYFPQPGEGPEIKAQKAKARRDELRNVQAMYPFLANQFPLDALPALADEEIIDLPSRGK